MIFVGTSGYSYPAWRGSFYPWEMKRGDMLPYYARRFPAVELNFTYYGIPHPSVFERMVERTPEGFSFAVKLNSAITHEKNTEAIVEFSDSIAPLRKSGRMCALLGQFPHGFSRSRRNMEYLRLLRKMLPDDEIVVEFRNDTWERKGVLNFLMDEALGYCCVDEPKIPGLLRPSAVATTPMGYIRFHSRNGTKWYEGGKERYNYLFSKKELGEWVPRVKALVDDVEKIYIFFNNCHAGHAAVNATELQEMFRELNLPVSLPSPEFPQFETCSQLTLTPK